MNLLLVPNMHQKKSHGESDEIGKKIKLSVLPLAFRKILMIVRCYDDDNSDEKLTLNFKITYKSNKP